MLRSRTSLVTSVWALLTTVTVGSWVLGSHASDAPDAVLSSVLVLVLAVVKVRLVGQHFMELRHAPAYARRALDAYCAVAVIALTVLYLAA